MLPILPYSPSLEEDTPQAIGLPIMAGDTFRAIQTCSYLLPGGVVLAITLVNVYAPRWIAPLLPVNRPLPLGRPSAPSLSSLSAAHFCTQASILKISTVKSTNQPGWLSTMAFKFSQFFTVISLQIHLLFSRIPLSASVSVTITASQF